MQLHWKLAPKQKPRCADGTSPTLREGKPLKAQAAALTREEMHAADSILNSTNSEWFAPDTGNDLWAGLDGGGAKSAADAFARWLLDGGRFICTGLDDNFSRERLQEFATVKAAAQKLLKTRQ